MTKAKTSRLQKAMNKAWVMLCEKQDEPQFWVVQNPTLAARMETLKAWRRRR